MPTRLPGEGACTTYAALTVDLVGTKFRQGCGRSGEADRRENGVLEVTERGIPDSIGLAEMEAAAQTGVRFALDDVMLDSANLAVLSRCKFHIVKIDRRLVADMA